MEKTDQMSMIEVAEMLIKNKKKPQNIRSLLKEVAEIKNIDENDLDLMAQLYIDITTNSKFVFCGDDTWDLKSRHSLDLWDKDGSHFYNSTEEEEEEEEITVDDYNLTEDEEEEIEDDEEDEDEDEDDVDFDEEEDVDFIDSDDEDDDVTAIEDEVEYDEDEYNKIMDDYEDLYDK